MTMHDLYTQGDFELTLGRAVMQEGGEHDGLVHVWWRDPAAADRLVQVYVNGEFFDVTTDPDQRELWLVLDRSRPNRVELLAVPIEASDLLWHAQPDRLMAWNPPVEGAAEALVLRDESLPIGTRIEVAVDGNVVTAGELWPGDVARSGFGGLFGLGGFGQDAASGLGLGRGELGWGSLGVDGTAWRWRDTTLAPGPHTIMLAARDAEGQALSPTLSLLPVVIDALPTAARSLTAEPDFTLVWTD